MEKLVRENARLGEKYTEITHESGLKIYISKKDLPTYYAIFGTRYGSIDNVFSVDGEEVEVPEGIAHFLEHKMFESEDGGDAFELYAETGADANAYTSFDQTAYLFSCNDRFYESLEVLLNMVTHPYFTKKSVQKEQGIIGEEIKMCEDRPSDALYYGSLRAMYASSPIRIPIAGTVESISKITPELLYKCYRSFYRMNNMALCICGNVDEDEVLRVVERFIPKDRQESPRFREYKEAPCVASEYFSTERDVSKPLFKIAVKFPEGTEENAPACSVLAGAMFDETEDFFADVYENGLVGQYYFDYECMRGASYFCIGGDSDNPEELYRRFKAYCKKIKSEGISAEAVERAKRAVYADVVRSFDRSESVADELFGAFLDGYDMLTLPERYMSVTKEDADDIAKIALNEERFCLSTVVPKNNK